MSESRPESRPFAGIKVLAVARVVACPFAAYQLALHGADVIRIEDTQSGDSMRVTGGKHLGFTGQGMGTAYLAQSANTRSMTLNMRSPEAQQIFRRMAQDADVVLENLLTGSMAKYGLDYESLRAINPRLVYCSLTGFGQTGPKKRQPANDTIIQAASGLMSLTGEADGGPVKTGAHIFDYGSGFAAALGIVTALYQRNATGRGQNVDVSMLETALVMNGDTVSDVLNAGARPMRHGNRGDDTGSINNVFKCRDGTWLLIAASREPQRRRLWPAIGRPDIAQDARFATPEARIGHMDTLYAEIEKALQAKTAREWEDILEAAAIGSSEVKTVGDALAHPHVQFRQPFHDVGVIPELGAPIKVPLAPYRLSEGGAMVHSPPPLRGQHTDEILAGLGYDAAGIARLRQDGVV